MTTPASLAQARYLAQAEHAAEVAPSGVTMYHARALARARRISWDDAFLVAHFFFWPPSAGLFDRARDRIAKAWNEALAAGQMCSILEERTRTEDYAGPLQAWRATVQIRGSSALAHTTMWHSEAARAARLAESWATLQGLIVADVFLESAVPFDRARCLALLAESSPEAGTREASLCESLRAALAEIDRLSAPWWR